MTPAAYPPSMRLASCLLFSASACLCAPALAQEQPAGAAETPATMGLSAAAARGDARVFEPAYFEQFAPRNALDMVAQIPGFSIDDGNDGQRGLGEANQNVIVNGERFSSKSDSVRDQLRRIPAGDVVRIEILDGNALDIPGLSGQVANIVYVNTGTSGQFRWRGGFRAHNTEAQLYGGEISLTGSRGDLDYTIALSNDNNRFGADGPSLITDASGAVIEEQFSKLSGKFDNPKLSAIFAYDFGAGTAANLNLSYGEDYFSRKEPETGISPDGLVRERDAFREEDGPEYEIGADIQFPFGPGTLKLIGLERFERDNFSSTVIDRFNDGRGDAGSRFTQVNEAGERIGRLEYGWNMWGGDWQISGEAAFNRLNRTSRLFELSPAGEFTEIAFPAGNGGVTEDRYEAILSYSRQITPKLSLQATGGAEYSKIEQTGVAANSRSFQRPKGSLSLAWKPEDDLDISVELRRRVGQLSFGDFLASVSINDDNANGGNNQLQPDQSWNVALQVNKGLGEWGSATFELEQVWYEDFIDFFPLPGGGEARGNIGSAERTQIELNTTLKMDPLGWNGARFEVRGIRRWDNVNDPFVGLRRPFSGRFTDLLDVNFRHDILGTDWAWGGGLFTDNRANYSRRFEIGRDYEGPTFANLFVEHKDVFGLTVNASYGNILGARNKFERVVFDGPRPNANIVFAEKLDRRIGPIFRFSVSGNF